MTPHNENLAYLVPFISRLKNTVTDRNASIPAVVEYEFMRLFDDVGRATGSGPDFRVVAVVRAVINLSVNKAF